MTRQPPTTCSTFASSKSTTGPSEVTSIPVSTNRSLGTVAKLDDSTVHISELPIRKWTQDYKEFLQKMLTENQKQPEKDEPKDVPEDAEPKDEDGEDEAPKEKKEEEKPKVTIEDFKEYHTENSVHFVIKIGRAHV